MDNFISVLLPSKNAGNYIKKSVESILNQTYHNFELIIIDESTDDSENIIKSFHSDKIIYKKVYNSNISKSLNLALKLASGDMIARMDADDISHPERFEVQLNYIKNHKDIHLVGSNVYFINDEGNVLSKKKLPEHHEKIEYWMPVLSTLLHATIMTYKSTIDNIMGYSENLDRAEDIDLFFRLFKNKCRFYNIQKYLYYYRVSFNKKEKIYSTRKIFKNLSFNYIKYKYETCNSRRDKYHKNFKYGLLEYYHGKMHIARRYLIEAMHYNPFKVFTIFRYLFFTFLGTRFMTILREKRIINFITKLLNKFTNYNSPGI